MNTEHLLAPCDPYYLFDAFVSCEAKDIEVAYRLIYGLEIRDRKLWFAPNCIRSGTSITEAIDFGLEHSRKFIALFSNAYLTSSWCTLERNAFLFSDPQNLNQRFLPVLIESCGPIPPTLRSLKQIDAREGFTTAVIEEINRHL